MRIAGVHEVIAGIALIIVGLVVGYDGPSSSMIWGAVMILLGILLLIFWSVGLT